MRVFIIICLLCVSYNSPASLFSSKNSRSKTLLKTLYTLYHGKGKNLQKVRDTVNKLIPKADVLFVSEATSPLHLAVKYKDKETVSTILETNPIPSRAFKALTPPLISAIEDGNNTMALLLIDKGWGINTADAMGKTPLHHSLGSPILVRALIDKGADPNYADKSGHTPLTKAIKDHSLTDVQILLTSPSIDLNTPRGNPLLPPLAYTCLIESKDTLEKDIAIIQALLDKKPSLTNAPYLSLLAGTHPTLAVQKATLFVDAGININLEDNNGNTPLLSSVYFHNKAMIEYLLKKGADPFSINTFGETPYLLALWDNVASVYFPHKATTDTIDFFSSPYVDPEHTYLYEKRMEAFDPHVRNEYDPQKALAFLQKEARLYRGFLHNVLYFQQPENIPSFITLWLDRNGPLRFVHKGRYSTLLEKALEIPTLPLSIIKRLLKALDAIPCAPTYIFLEKLSHTRAFHNALKNGHTEAVLALLEQGLMPEGGYSIFIKYDKDSRIKAWFEHHKKPVSLPITDKEHAIRAFNNIFDDPYTPHESMLAQFKEFVSQRVKNGQPLYPIFVRRLASFNHETTWNNRFLTYLKVFIDAGAPVRFITDTYTYETLLEVACKGPAPKKALTYIIEALKKTPSKDATAEELSHRRALYSGYRHLKDPTALYILFDAHIRPAEGLKFFFDEEFIKSVNTNPDYDINDRVPYDAIYEWFIQHYPTPLQRNVYTRLFFLKRPPRFAQGVAQFMGNDNFYYMKNTGVKFDTSLSHEIAKDMRYLGKGLLSKSTWTGKHKN